MERKFVPHTVLLLCGAWMWLAPSHAAAVDPSFSSSVMNGDVLAVEVAENGSILAGGNFSQWNGEETGAVVRLTPDGRLDRSFSSRDAWTGTDPAVVEQLVVQSDGKIIVAGRFEVGDGVSPDLVRLHADGSLDEQFLANLGAGFSRGSGGGFTASRVMDIDVQPDGAIICAGHFTEFNGQRRVYLARLHSDGRLDEGFSPDVRTTFTIEAGIYEVELMDDGSIVAGGFFSSEDQYPNPILMKRFFGDGSTAPPFGAGISFSYLFDMKTAADGSLILAGTRGGGSYPMLERIGRNGELLETFPFPGEWEGDARDVAIEPEGTIVAAGAFHRSEDGAGRHIAVIAPSGVVDMDLEERIGLSGAINAMALTHDGILLGGRFTTNGGDAHTNLVKLTLPSENQQHHQSSVPAKKKRLTIHVPAAGSYILEASIDFKTWTLLKQGEFAEGEFVIDDSLRKAGNHMFYRLRPASL